MRKKVVTLTLIIALFFTSTGFLTIEYNVSLEKEGQASLTYVMALDDTAISDETAKKSIIEEIRRGLGEKGFDTEEYKGNGISGVKTTKRFDDITQMKNLEELFSGEKETKQKPPFAREKKILYEKQIFDANFNLTNILSDDTVKEKTKNSILPEMTLTFTLSTSNKIHKHNADFESDDGKTLIWNLKPGETNYMMAEMYILNRINISILILTVLLIVAIIIKIIDVYKKKNI